MPNIALYEEVYAAYTEAIKLMPSLSTMVYCEEDTNRPECTNRSTEALQYYHNARDHGSHPSSH